MAGLNAGFRAEVSTRSMSVLRTAFTLLALGGLVLCGVTPARAQQPAAVATSAGYPIGAVAAVQGGASVTRSAVTTALKIKDAIFKGDVLQTAADGTLGIAFADATAFSLRPNSRIAVDEFVYQDGGGANAATFEVLRGSIAFVASAVAKTGSMSIDTPLATIGIRGTTGVIDIVGGGAGDGSGGGGGGQSTIKLYADADGRVGRIEVFGRDGTSLGVLTRAVTGFAVRPGPGGAVAAVPVQVTAAEADRDFAFVRRAYAVQSIARRLNLLRRLVPPPTPGPSIGPTLQQPQLGPLPGTIPPNLPAAPQLPNALPPVTPPSLPPAQPLPGPPTPALPTPGLPAPSPPTPGLPRLPR
jgi:hypothetical protein